MSTKAFVQFKKTIQRSEGMLQFYMRNKDIKGISFPKDIVRGAVVLSVAAFDAYVSNVFIEKLIPYIKNNPIKKDMVEFLEQTGLTTKRAIELLAAKEPYKKVRKMADNYYMTHPTQSFKTVNELFQRFSIKDIVTKAADATTGKDIMNSIESLIDRRHQIAHNGDYSKAGKLMDIDEMKIMKMVKILDRFVGSLDGIVGEI